MISRSKAPVLLAALLVILSGCSQKESKKKSSAPPPPPPKTADELYRQVESEFRSMAAAGTLAQGQAKQFMQTQNQKLSGEQNGPAALDMLKKALKAEIRNKEDEKNWDMVLGLAEALEVLDPTNLSLARYRERAMLEKSRPIITATGVYEDKDTGATFFFVDIYNPLTGVSEKDEVREGEEFHGVRFEEVVGNNRGMRLRYLPTGEEFEVLLNE